MIPFHSVLPEIAQREVRCVHLLPQPGVTPRSGLPGGEFYCEDLGCNCRRVFLQVVARHHYDRLGAVFPAQTLQAAA